VDYIVLKKINKILQFSVVFRRFCIKFVIERYLLNDRCLCFLKLFISTSKKSLVFLILSSTLISLSCTVLFLLIADMSLLNDSDRFDLCLLNNLIDLSRADYFFISDSYEILLSYGEKAFFRRSLVGKLL
jgi:hypothetical protein